MAAGRRFDERAVIGIGLELAQVLEYLHGLSPPIIHRDVKPSNVVLRDDGKVFLVDFGAVKDRIDRSALDEATVVGTFGYMPLEQFEGRAVPASDLYSLGVTLVFLLSQRPPAEIPRRAMRLDFRACVRVSSGLAAVLDRLLQPDPEARYASAAALGRELQGLLDGPRPPAPVTQSRRRILGAAVLAAAAIGILGVRARRPASEGPAPNRAQRSRPPRPTRARRRRGSEPAEAPALFPAVIGPSYVHGCISMARTGSGALDRTAWAASTESHAHPRWCSRETIRCGSPRRPGLAGTTPSRPR